MSGAGVAAVVAVVAWIGLWLYLRVLQTRLEAAVDELDAEAEHAPTVEETDGTSDAG